MKPPVGVEVAPFDHDEIGVNVIVLVGNVALRKTVLDTPEAEAEAD
jgi:hypothetical protein